MSDSAPGVAPEALGVIELASIARGYRVLDAMVKRSPIDVRSAYPVSSGKFLIFVQGSVAEVDEAMDAGINTAESVLVGNLFLPFCHPQIWRALDHDYPKHPIDALAVLESQSVVDAVLGADTALKAAEVSLEALHLAKGIGGRAYFALTGELYDVEAGMEAALYRMRPDLVLMTELIQRPHDQMTQQLLGLETIHDKY